jgi:hypothetical protein
VSGEGDLRVVVDMQITFRTEAAPIMGRASAQFEADSGQQELKLESRTLGEGSLPNAGGVQFGRVVVDQAD